MRRSLLALLCAAAVLLMLPAAAQAITFDKAVDKLFRQGYPQRLEKTITGFKSTPLGFRWTGSPADNQAAQFLADEMTAAGLTEREARAGPRRRLDHRERQRHGRRQGHEREQLSRRAADRRRRRDRSGRAHPQHATAADFDKAGDITGKIAVVAFDSRRLVVQLPLRRGRPARRQGRHPHLRQAVPGLPGRAERVRVQRPRLHLHVAAARLAAGRLGVVAQEADEEGAGHGHGDAAVQPHLRRGRRRGLQRDRRAAGQERRRHQRRLRRPPRLALHRRPRQRHVLRRPARHRQGHADERPQAREHDGLLQHDRRGVGLHRLQLRLAGRLRVLDPAHAPGLGRQGQGDAQHGVARLQEGQPVVHRHA